MSEHDASLVVSGDIVLGLRRLGMGPGDRVLVHSSLSSFGYVEGGAPTVIDALLNAVGPEGTVLVPTLTGDEALSPANPPRFDPRSSSCWTGRIPETFRMRPDAIRSLHPTHSVAAIGRDAESLTREHIHSITPCDERSPYGKLAELSNSYVLLLGVSYQSLTLLHHVEEIAGADYHMQGELVRAELIMEGAPVYRHYFLHRYGTPRNFGVLEPLLEERGLQTVTIVGQARLRLISAPGLVDAALRCLHANPRFFCAAA